jgi:GT2 family glycosyltransferase
MADLDEDRPRTTVLICSRDRPTLLRDAITQVLDMSVLPDEIVVVDQSREPDAQLAELVSAHGVELRYDWSQETGLSRARNRGLSLATGDVVAMTDDDVLVDRTWLADVVDALVAEGPRCLVTGTVRPGAPEQEGAWAPSTITDPVPRRFAGLVDTDPLYPCNLALWRSTARGLGPFDVRLGAGTNLPAAEDNDFGYRALKAGHTIAYLPHLGVTHRAWRDEGALAALMLGYGTGQGAFYAKHVRGRDRFVARRAVRDLGQHVRRGLVLAMKGNRTKATSDLAYSLGLVRGALLWWVGS